MKDRLDLLADADPEGFATLRLAALAKLIWPELSDEQPGDQPSGEQVFHFNDLSKQHVSEPVRIPDSCRIEWNYQTSEPPPTEGPIQLVIFEAYIGEDWIGRERFTILARRRFGKWEIFIGWGLVEANGDGWKMKWFSRTKKDVAWADIINGAVALHDGEVGGLANGGQADGPRVRFEPRGREWRIQVGHEDSAKGQVGRGDEPFMDGSGELVIYDLATAEDDEPTGEFPPADLPEGVMPPTDLDEAMKANEGKAMASKRLAGWPSGTPAVDCKALREVAPSVLYYLEKWITTGAVYVRHLPLRRGPDALHWWLAWLDSCRHCGVDWAYTEEQMRGFFALSEFPEVAIGQRYVPASAVGRRVAAERSLPLSAVGDYVVMAVHLSQNALDNWRATPVGLVVDAAYDLAAREADVLDEQGHIDRHPLWRRWLR